MRLLSAVAVLSLIGMIGLAQDPFTVAPQAYKLQFENNWVKVTRVHYGPRESVPAHDHTRWAAAYVYLNDSGPVIFKHSGLDYGAITRPPTKAGSFRLFRAVKEVHAVENASDLPSDFLRIELKTQTINERSLQGRYYRENYPAGENYRKVQFENEQLRVTRLICVTGKRIDVSTTASEPALLVALSPAQVKLPGRNSFLKTVAGETIWLDTNQSESLENTSAGMAELLRFDFKTKPVGDTSRSVGNR